MKADIHPNYKDISFNCACGAKFVAGSTIQKDFNTEICSQCHPFYTGKQKLLDTSGRVDKFRAKMEKAQEIAAKNVKKVDSDEFEEELEEKVEKVAKKKKPVKEEKAEAAEEVELEIEEEVEKEEETAE